MHAEKPSHVLPVCAFTLGVEGTFEAAPARQGERALCVRRELRRVEYLVVPVEAMSFKEEKR